MSQALSKFYKIALTSLYVLFSGLVPGVAILILARCGAKSAVLYVTSALSGAALAVLTFMTEPGFKALLHDPSTPALFIVGFVAAGALQALLFTWIAIRLRVVAPRAPSRMGNA